MAYDKQKMKCRRDFMQFYKRVSDINMMTIVR